jgi:hypothetical protein
MIPIVVLNAILCLGVIVMVVSPLIWAILTQHRDVARVHARTRRTVRHRRIAATPRHLLGDGRGWARTSDLSRVKRALSH